MAFSKKVDFLQRERDELPNRRPVIIYVVAAVCSEDYSMRNPSWKLFQKSSTPALPDGVLTREGNPYNLCLIEASPELVGFDSQLSAALDAYNEASYKVVVINGHGYPDGVLMREGDEKISLCGDHLARLASSHLHGNHLNVFTLFAHGHTFASAFAKFLQEETPIDVQKLVAITFFTSKESPTVWSKVATTGNPPGEIKQSIREFLRKTIELNSPYKVLEPQLLKAQCNLL